MADTDEVDRRVAADIERFGWHVVLVPPDGDAAGWAFSIGLHERFGHPEVAVFGLDLELLHQLVNLIGERVRDGARFEATSVHGGLLRGYRCEFRAVQRRWIEPFFGNAAWHYRSDEFPLLQCFWPDAGGRLPWEPGFDAAWREVQPLLYEPDPERALGAALRASLAREGMSILR